MAKKCGKGYQQLVIGGANQTAMLEVFGASKSMFAQMIAVDVLVANLWMGFYFMGPKIR
jgi:ABC-type xylose transport system substrate-binding protein